MDVINVLYDKGIDHIKDKTTSSFVTGTSTIDNCSSKDKKD
jgi:hypothetical protein